MVFLVLSDIAEFCYKCTDFYHPVMKVDLHGMIRRWDITWPELQGEYKGTSSAEGYHLADGTPLNLSDERPEMAVLKDYV